MATKDTHLRPGLLNSKLARQRLEHRAAEQVYSHLFATIDGLAAMHDGLAALRANQDPTQTKEANALAYRQAYDRAQAKATEMADALFKRLAAYQVAVERQALEAAGIATDTPSGAEIRSALRSLPRLERDKAVSAAIDRGDAAVIAAIAHATSPVLTGDIGTPVAGLTKLFVDKAVPTHRQDLADSEQALEFLNFAVGSFRSSTAELRDPQAEDRAQEGQSKAAAAAEVWAEALREIG